LQANAAETSFSITYKVIKEYGKISDLTKKVGQGEILEESIDGKNAYILKQVEVKDEQHLLRLMGAADENGLSDTQRGFLGVFRTARSEAIAEVNSHASPGKRRLNIMLTDVNGYEDREKYPWVKKDFWPKAVKTYSYDGKGSITNIDLTISGVDAKGMGNSTADEMKATFAHEFGHSIESTRIEMNPYGYDGFHYHNEVIGEQAAFAEGFANYIEMQMYPSKIREFRNGLNQIWVENASGGYRRFNPDDEGLPATSILKVEAINSLILNRITKEIPDGREKFWAVFSRFNSWQNSLSGFLKAYIKEYPSDANQLAQIVDGETYKRLSNDELRKTLGDSIEVEIFLRSRKDVSGKPLQTRVAPPAGTTEVVVQPTGGKPRVYKWKDENGSWHFTDYPPPGNVKYTVSGPVKVPQVDHTERNPFSDQ